MAEDNLIKLTTDIVSAHVSNNKLAAGDVPTLIKSVFDALSGIAAPAPVEEPKPEPAVAIRSSVKPEYIVCLEDGAKLKMLKRYLSTRFGLTPDEYRAKWGLPKDYPMVAPKYAEHRRALAHKIGLGRNGRGAPPSKPTTPTTPTKPAPRRRSKPAPAPTDG